MLVCCKKNNNIAMFESPIGLPCNTEFDVEKESIFAYAAVDYDSSTLYQYYTVCPHCYNFVLIPSENLSEEEKKEAITKTVENPFLYQINFFQSKLNHYKSKSNSCRSTSSKTLVRVK